MTRLRTPWWPLVRYDCDGVNADGLCNHGFDDWGDSIVLYEFDSPWRTLRAHGWTHYTKDGWTHHRCGNCNADIARLATHA